MYYYGDHHYYKNGYKDGLDRGYEPLTYENTHMTMDERAEYERGLRDGKNERWRRDDEDDW